MPFLNRKGDHLWRSKQFNLTVPIQPRCSRSFCSAGHNVLRRQTSKCMAPRSIATSLKVSYTKSNLALEVGQKLVNRTVGSKHPGLTSSRSICRTSPHPNAGLPRSSKEQDGADNPSVVFNLPAAVIFG